MRLAPLLVLLLLPLSGCLSGDDSGDGPETGEPSEENDDVWAPIQALMKGVPCEAEVGSGQSTNLVQLANVSYNPDHGIHGELDIKGDLALHARYDQGGFEIVDISNPLAPEFLGYYDYNDEDNGDALDVKFSPDNATALYGLGGGVHMVDVRDPLNPVPVGEWKFSDITVTTDPLPRVSQNAHMLATARIAEQDWVFIAPNSNTGIYVLKLMGTPDARSLEYVTQTLPVEGGPLGPHDLYIEQDAVDGNWYLYSADGFHGWTVFNINDPASPEVAGGIANPVEGAYTHSIQSEWVNGRRLVATIGEVGANALKVYDATLLRAPVLLAVWQAEPGEGSAAPEHNFNVVAGKAYLSYYTLGMYIFDFTQLSGLPVAGSAELTPVGHYGNNPEQAPGPLDFSGIWDTLLKDGLIYLSDINGGLVVVGYGCNAVPDPSLTSNG